MKNKIVQSYNVRVYRHENGSMSVGFVMRAAKRGKSNVEWVDASHRDRSIITSAISGGKR